MFAVILQSSHTRIGSIYTFFLNGRLVLISYFYLNKSGEIFLLDSQNNTKKKG